MTSDLNKVWDTVFQSGSRSGPPSILFMSGIRIISGAVRLSDLVCLIIGRPEQKDLQIFVVKA